MPVQNLRQWCADDVCERQKGSQWIGSQREEMWMEKKNMRNEIKCMSWKCFLHSYLAGEHQHRNVRFDFASFRRCREAMFARIIYSHLNDFKKIISICMIRVVVVIVEVFTLFVTPCLYLHTLKIGKHKRCNYFWSWCCWCCCCCFCCTLWILHSLFHTQHCNALWFCWLCAWNLNPMLLVRMIRWFYELLHLCIAILHSHTYSLVWRWIICAQTYTHTRTEGETGRKTNRKSVNGKESGGEKEMAKRACILFYNCFFRNIPQWILCFPHRHIMARHGQQPPYLTEHIWIATKYYKLLYMH